MRILFDSKKHMFKDPFGTLTPKQTCTLHIHIPTSVGAVKTECLLSRDEDGKTVTALLLPQSEQGDYTVFGGDFCLPEPGLYFYYFRIYKPEGSFRLFKYGQDDTNMEAGGLWQVSCIPEDFTTPDWAKGAVIYQVFPDRFCKSGECDLTGKLTPYTVHKDWNEEVVWEPDEKGVVWNNDFYGGNFRGITEKMDYIASLGTTILYLNPISKSHSTHRYDTGDYKAPDPMLGTMEDFHALCDAAHARGIKVVLDGVYSHTGSNSLYFDKNKTFGGGGAYNSPDSPYYSWYTFQNYPDTYTCWWNFDTLPTVRKMDSAFIEYIISGEDSVVAHWLKNGADGFRLDVVDELPNEFVKLLKERIRGIRPDALLIGEVWEDASNKIAYDVRRRYFVDSVLDSCMNYPFRTAILNFLRGKDDGKGFKNAIMTVLENYPPQVVACNMNMLGTHDTPRILTALVDEFEGDRKETAKRHLTPTQKEKAEKLLLLASVLQYTLPGAPSLYYADEAGMEGHKDPFNRRTYPWGKENKKLLTHFQQLGQLKKASPALQASALEFFQAGDGKIGFTRRGADGCFKIYVNLGVSSWKLSGKHIALAEGLSGNELKPMGFCIEKWD